MNRIMAATALALACSAAPAIAGDAALGEEKAVTCIACHGEGGAKPISPQYPILAGQYADYLEQALLQYKSGSRKNMIMAGIVASLTEEDFKNLAAYFAAQDSPLATVD